MNRKRSRLRRALKTRAKIRQSDICRLTVHRTSRHIYAQVISVDGRSVLAAASTLQADLRKELASTSNLEAAVAVGTKIAQSARACGVERVAFDRSGFKYHGRVKGLADAAREAGLIF